MPSIQTSLLLAASVVAGASVPPVLAQQVTGEPGSPGATTTISGKQLPPPASAIRRGDQGEGLGVDSLVAAARRAAEGRARTCCSS